MSKIFLSHTSTDKAFVRKLAADLRNYGHTVWMDEAEINTRDSLIREVSDGIDAIDYIAAVLSGASIGTNWVEKELKTATTRPFKGKWVPVLPLIIEQVALPAFLEGKDCTDFSDPGEYKVKLQQLLDSLGDSKLVTPADYKALQIIQKELIRTKEIIDLHRIVSKKPVDYSVLSTRSAELQELIASENEEFPEYAPINNVYAFQMKEFLVTNGVMMNAIGRTLRRGWRVIEVYMNYCDQWADLERMYYAYNEMIQAQIAITPVPEPPLYKY